MLNFYQNWNSIMNVGVLGIDGGSVSGGVMVGWWWYNFINNFMPFTLCNEGNTKYIVNLSSLRHKLSCAQRKSSAELFRWNTCWPKHFSNRVDHVAKQQRVVKLQTFNVLRKLIRFEQGKCTVLAQLSSFSHLNIHKGLFKNWANRAMS